MDSAKQGLRGESVFPGMHSRSENQFKLRSRAWKHHNKTGEAPPTSATHEYRQEKKTAGREEAPVKESGALPSRQTSSCEVEWIVDEPAATETDGMHVDRDKEEHNGGVHTTSIVPCELLGGSRRWRGRVMRNRSRSWGKGGGRDRGFV